MDKSPKSASKSTNKRRMINLDLKFNISSLVSCGIVCSFHGHPFRKTTPQSWILLLGRSIRAPELGSRLTQPKCIAFH